EQRRGVHAAGNQLDGNALLELIVVAFGEVNRPHAAAADLAQDAVSPQPLSFGNAQDLRLKAFRRAAHDAGERFTGLVPVESQQRFYFFTQFAVVAAFLIKVSGSPVGIQVDRPGQDGFHPAPSLRCHAYKLSVLSFQLSVTARLTED